MASHARPLDELPPEIGAEVRDLMSRLEAHDPRAARLAPKISELVGRMCDDVGLKPERSQKVVLAALLHDVGKLNVAKAMLEWPGDLDEKQWGVMRNHVNVKSLLSQQLRDYLGGDLDGIVNHHEYFKGGGYPTGIAHDAQLSSAQIIGLASAFVAMTNPASYRDGAMTRGQALARLKEESAHAWNPTLISCLNRVADVAPKERQLAFAAPSPVIAAGLAADSELFYVRYFERARSAWDSRRVRIAVPIAAVIVAAAVIGAIMSGGSNKGPVNVAKNDPVSTGGQFTPATDSFGNEITSPDGSPIPDLSIAGIPSAGSGTGTVTGSNGAPLVVNPDGTVTQPDGTVVSPVQNSDGSISWPGVESTTPPETLPNGDPATPSTDGSTPTTTGGSPGTNPPATNPPGTNPPATQPPATQPPATNPPATQPPATQPPTPTTQIADVPAGFKAVHWNGCLIGIKLTQTGSGANITSLASTWIRSGDQCVIAQTLVSTIINGTQGHASSAVTNIGGASAITAPISRSGGVVVSYHYIQTKAGTCARFQTVETYTTGTFGGYSVSSTPFDAACPQPGL